MLKRLTEALRKAWTEETYSEEFQARNSIYKNFDHALKHIDKARARLMMMTEEADHHREPLACFPKGDIEKYLADIVISVARAAETCPWGPIDLEKAVRERMAKKMDVIL